MTSVRFNRSTDGLCKKVSNSRLGDTKSFPDRKRLTAFAHIACGLKKARTLEVLGRVVAGVKRSINDVRRYSKVHPDFAPAGARLIAALESAAAGIAELPRPNVRERRLRGNQAGIT